MPSKVGIIKEMRQAVAAEQGKDPGPKAGEQLFAERCARFEAVRAEQGAEAAVASDELLGLYFANLWVGDAFRPQGPEVRAAVKKLRVLKSAQVEGQTQSVTEAVAQAQGVEMETAKPAAEVYQETLDQIEASLAEKGIEVRTVAEHEAADEPEFVEEGERPAYAEPLGYEDQTPLTEAQAAELAGMENAYAVADVIEAGQSVAPRKLDMEALRLELRMVDLFIASVESNHEAPSRRVTRRRQDLVKAIARRAV